MTRISVDDLKEKIYYDPNSGAIINTKNGAPAGWLEPDGYTRLKIGKRTYKGTHVAYALMEGSWVPEGFTIDHRDRDPTNNKWNNLRLATPAQQVYNQDVSKRNKLGVRGVSKCGNKYRVRATKPDGTELELGRFDTLEEAKLVRMRAELEYYGTFSPLVST